MALDTSRLSPDDARAAVVSLARRWRALLTTFEEGEDAEALVRRQPVPGEPSVHDLALGGLHAMCWARATLDTILTHRETPPVGPIADHVCSPSVRPGIGPFELASRMSDEATQLAAAIGAVHRAADWNLAGRLPDGSSLTAIGVVRGVVRVLTDDLHRSEQTLREVR